MSESDLLAWNEANDYENEDQDQDHEDYPAGTACALIHEHDPATCAGASVAELLLDSVRAQLVDVVARIDGTFEDEESSSHWALEKVSERLELLLELVGGVKAPPILGSEDGCISCGAHWSWSSWATEADRATRRAQHGADCDQLLEHDGGQR